MSRPPAKPDHQFSAKPINPPEPANYTDELTAEQLAYLRTYAPQDESLMGSLVHEFRW